MTIHGVQISNNSIKWEWNGIDKASYILDENNEILYQNSVGVCSYVENNLKEEHTYKRRIVLFDENGLGEPSDLCSVTLEKNEEVEIYKSFIEEKRDETIEHSRVEEISSKLKAFKSGVGDLKDLKISKTNDTSYIKKFKLINKIYGVRASKVTKHNTIKFSYRFKLKGIEEYKTFNSSFKIKIKCQKISNMNTYPNYVLSGEEISSENISINLKDKVYIANIYVNNFFENLVKDYSQRYRFTIEITDIVGGVKVYSQAYGEADLNEGESLSFYEYGYYDHKVSIIGYQKTEEREYIEYYPPLKYEPLVAAINGDFEMVDSGLKDINIVSPKFETSEFVKDKKYFCDIEEITPSSGFVSYKFKNQVDGENYTLKNGDLINFSSNSIIEDDTEERYLVSQIELGEYEINDNVKHTYKYKIDDCEVNEAEYKRFELDIVPSNNDVIILNHTKFLETKDGKINTDITVHVRSIQNAIAKWSPAIQSGYYYLNQDEYFLYSKSVCDGAEKELSEIFIKPTVNVLSAIETVKPPGEIKYFEIKKEKIYDILNNEKDFYFRNNMLYPKPVDIISDRDGVFFYDYKDCYEYESYPFIFEEDITSLNEVIYSFIANNDNRIEAFIVPYNQIVGSYSSPIQINSGEVSDIPVSKIYKLQFKLYPCKKPNLVAKSYNIASKWDFEYFNDSFPSIFSYTTKGYVSIHSQGVSGFYVSNYIDLGDSGNPINEREIDISIQAEGAYKVYIENVDIRNDKIINSSFKEYDKKILKAKRFFRIKIELSKDTIIKSIKINVKRYEHIGMNIDMIVPSIGRFTLKAVCNPSETRKTYTHLTSYPLNYDSIEHVAINDVEEYKKQVSEALNFNFNEISSISFLEAGERQDEFNAIYKDNKLLLKSNKVELDFEEIENSQNGVEFPFKSTIVTTPMIQQFSPIVIYKKVNNKYSKEPLQRVSFFNGEKFTLENKEEFIYEGYKTYYLEYEDIELNSIRIYIDNEITTDFSLESNIISIDNINDGAKKITVFYKIKDSYCVNLNLLEDSTKIDFNVKDTEKVKIFYETNKISSSRLMKNISLNPIYSSRTSGFVYLTDTREVPVKIEITLESEMIFANGKDTMLIFIKILDKYNNPVQGESVNVSVALGKIKKLDETTDINGIIRCEYTSFTGNSIDVINCITYNDIKASKKILNRKL